MKLIVPIILLAISADLVGAAEAPPPWLDFERIMYGAPIPHEIKEWTKLRFTGPTTVTPPIILFSDKAFSREAPETRIHHSASEYRTFSLLIRGQHCLGPVGNSQGPQEVFDVTTKTKDTETHCAMSQPVACSYLSSIAAQKSVGLTLNGSHSENFAATAECAELVSASQTLPIYGNPRCRPASSMP
jgi:hypothetical protein